MTYCINVKRDAEKELKKLPQQIELRIRVVLENLAQNPRPRQCKRLKEMEHYRIRVGEYRIIYIVNDRSKSVFITSIAHRKDVYRF